MDHSQLKLSAPKLNAGDRVAVLSPSFAAPGFAPAVHEQAMRRLTSATGLIPVEFPTTRKLGSSPEERAADINAAFADPSIHAILATIGGDDQITVVPHLDEAAVRANPKIFVGYSDNTNLLNWLWSLGIRGYYGGSTQVHLGAGPGADDVHLASLRAALLTGGELEITDPGESEDFGPDWLEPRALVDYGDREPTEPWTWTGPERTVSGYTWGGCIEVLDQLAIADRLPSVDALRGTILILESSELLVPARLGQAMGSSARRAWCPGGGRRRDGRQASSQQPRAGSACRRTGSAPRRTARCGQHRNRTIQPGRRRVRRGSLRAHPTAVDPPLRRSNPTRRRSQEGHSQLCLIVAGSAVSTRRVIIISYAVGRTF